MSAKLWVAHAEERLRRPIPAEPQPKGGDDDGPRRPDVQRPSSKELLDRMRRVDPDAARRYRQRSGE
ncbi:MAG: ubiquitin-like protein UBact [Armatimonadota bacterium]